jgi:hypothetical protein
MNLSFQLIKAFDVAKSLAANLLKELAITGVNAQAPATTSMKPSALGQNASNLNLRPVLSWVVELRRRGQWSKVEDLKAERKEEGVLRLPFHHREYLVKALQHRALVLARPRVPPAI